MRKKNARMPDEGRPLAGITVGEFTALLREVLSGEREHPGERLTARGLTELAGHLGCGRSKVSALRRLGVLDGAVISDVGRQTVFDVSEAIRLVSEYQNNR